jgi:hypothetical protein
MTSERMRRPRVAYLPEAVDLEAFQPEELFSILDEARNCGDRYAESVALAHLERLHRNPRVIPTASR